MTDRRTGGVGVQVDLAGSPVLTPVEAWKAEVATDSPVAAWDCQDASLSLQSFPATTYPLASTSGANTFLRDPGPGPIPYAVRSNATPEIGNASVPATTYASFTLEVWAKVAASPSKGPILTWSGNNGPGLGIGLNDWDTSGGNLVLVKQGTAWVTTGVALDANWHHLVVTSSGTTWTAYIDGAQVWTSTVVSTGTAPNAGLWLTGDTPYHRKVAASVAGAALYSTPLSAARVRTHYRAGAGLISPTVSATQATALARTLAIQARPPSVTQATAVALVLVVTGGGTTSSVTVSAGQAQVVGLARAVTLRRAVTQPVVVSLAQQFRLTRLVTQAQAAVSVIGKGYQRVVTATQAMSLRLVRQFRLTRALTGSHRISQRVSLPGFQLGRALRVSAPTSVRVVRQIRLTRALTQGTAVSLSGLPVKLQVVATQQTRSLALGRVITLVRAIAQATVASLPRDLTFGRTIEQPTALARVQALSLARTVAQAQAVSLAVEDVTPRLFLTVSTTVGQQLALTMSDTGAPAKHFRVREREASFVVAGRASQFVTSGRRVRFIVEVR
jgi:hypothetical protein